MKRTILISIFLFTLSSIFSQNKKTYSVNGYVQDKESGETLIGCYVLDSASKKGVLTNAFGYFNIQLEAGTSTILVHDIGYSDRTTNLHINKDTTIVIKLSTQPRVAMSRLAPRGLTFPASFAKLQSVSTVRFPH